MPICTKLQGTFTMVGFIEFLQLVIQYCDPGKMTDLTIFGIKRSNDNMIDTVIDDGLVAQVQPFLHRLDKIGLYNSVYANSQFRQFLEFFRHNLPFLRSFTVENDYDLQGICSHYLPDELPNITEVHISNGKGRSCMKNFQLLFNRFKNLQVFLFNDPYSDLKEIEATADCLYKSFPNLKGFGCSIEQILHTDSEIGDDDFKFLEKFKHLTEFHVVGHKSIKATDIQNIIKFVPNIKLLSLYQLLGPGAHQLPVVIRRIVRSIKEIVEDRSDRLHVIVNIQQYREFRAIKNIDNYIVLEQKERNSDIDIDYLKFRSSS